jgi:hypothetical protein
MASNQTPNRPTVEKYFIGSQVLISIFDFPSVIERSEIQKRAFQVGTFWPALRASPEQRLHWVDETQPSPTIQPENPDT